MCFQKPCNVTNKTFYLPVWRTHSKNTVVSSEAVAVVQVGTEVQEDTLSSPTNLTKAPFTQDAWADLRANHLMLLATCVNTPIDNSVSHNLLMPVARCSASCVNGVWGILKEKPHTFWFTHSFYPCKANGRIHCLRNVFHANGYIREISSQRKRVSCAILCTCYILTDCVHVSSNLTFDPVLDWWGFYPREFIHITVGSPFCPHIRRFLFSIEMPPA